MKSGDILTGLALDTARNEFRQECLKLNLDSREELVVLDDISVLEVCVNNPHFKSVNFP